MTIRWHKLLALGVVIGLMGAGVFLTPHGQKLEEKFGLYWLFHLRGPIAAPDDVVIVALDQPSATQFNLPLLPRLWPREMHAQLIERLTAAGARIIVFDLIFDAPGSVPEHDKQLSRAMSAAGNTVLIERLTYRNTGLTLDENRESSVIRHEGTMQLLPAIADAARATAPFPLPKAERVNDYWVFKASAGDFPTVPVVVLQLLALPLHGELIRLLADADAVSALQLSDGAISRMDVEDAVFAMRQLFVHNPQLTGEIQTRVHRHATLNAAQKRLLAALLAVYSGEEKYHLNFYGPPRTVKTIPYFQAFQSLIDSDAAATNDFKNKVVFVGFSGATQPEQDLVRDDYHTVFSNPDGLYISGVEIAATAVANLLENKPLTPLAYPDSLTVIFLFGLILGIVFQKISTRNAILCVMFVAVFYAFCAYCLFKRDAIWVPLVIPLMQIVFAFVAAEALKHYWAEEKARQLEAQLAEIKKILGPSYPDPAIEDVLGKDRDETEIQGLCLTTDVEGYTALSEPMAPGALSHLMAQYRDVLKNPIKQHCGHIMDMTGDSMLAIWIADPENMSARAQACDAALNLAAAVERFNRSQPQDGPRLPTRIGLHFGEMALRRGGGNYSVAGDVVNTANRVQSANKILRTRILLSGEVTEDLDGFLIRALGSFLMPGRIKPIQLFDLVAQRQSAHREQQWICERFACALTAYHAQQWMQAERGFADILDVHPLDGPSRFYRSLCQRYETESLTGLWPIYRIDSK